MLIAYGSYCRGQHSAPNELCVVKSTSAKPNGAGIRWPLIRPTASHTTESVHRGIAAIHVTVDLPMLDDVSRACACFLNILAYMLGAQDMRNVTTRFTTCQPGGLRFGLRLPVRR